MDESRNWTPQHPRENVIMKTKSLVACAVLMVALTAGSAFAQSANNLLDPTTAQGLLTVNGELRKNFNNIRFDVNSGRVRIWNTSTLDYFQFTTNGFEFVRPGATYFDNNTANASTRFRLST